MAVHRREWLAVSLAGAAGIAFTGTQIVERITSLKDPGAALACDVNATVSCTNVLGAWQSSVVLGVPNALIGAVMFGMFLSAGLSGLLGTELSGAYSRLLLGLAVFFAAFASWFMWQTAWDIGSLCVWCTGIVTCVALIGAAVTLVVGPARPWTWLWAAWWVALAGIVSVGLWL
jgi:uncharacterized membrane protein